MENFYQNLTKKNCCLYDFRQNDLKNGGEGAPLTPIFHSLIKNKYQRGVICQLIFLNIGGITNFTYLGKSFDTGKKTIKNC